MTSHSAATRISDGQAAHQQQQMGALSEEALSSLSKAAMGLEVGCGDLAFRAIAALGAARWRGRVVAAMLPAAKPTGGAH